MSRATGHVLNGASYSWVKRFRTVQISWLWILALIGAPAVALLTVDTVHRSRASEGRCPLCGYDLRATPARCPECGHQPSTPNEPAANAGR